MMLAAIVSCTVLAIVAFSIGFVCGKDAGRHQAESAAAAKALERRFAARRNDANPYDLSTVATAVRRHR